MTKGVLLIVSRVMSTISLFEIEGPSPSLSPISRKSSHLSGWTTANYWMEIRISFDIIKYLRDSEYDAVKGSTN